MFPPPLFSVLEPNKTTSPANVPEVTAPEFDRRERWPPLVVRFLPRYSPIKPLAWASRLPRVVTSALKVIPPSAVRDKLALPVATIGALTKMFPPCAPAAIPPVKTCTPVPALSKFWMLALVILEELPLAVNAPPLMLTLVLLPGAMISMS